MSTMERNLRFAFPKTCRYNYKIIKEKAETVQGALIEQFIFPIHLYIQKLFGDNRKHEY